jgi:hypothetical protein
MRRSIKTGAAAGALTFAFASPAFAEFLPDQATYDGKTNHGGSLTYKVRNHRITHVQGMLPLPKEGSCSFADARRVPINFRENDPVDSGPFKIYATLRRNQHTPDWRRIKLRISGQFDSAAERAAGKIHAKVYDRDGTCETRDDLTWHVSRSS